MSMHTQNNLIAPHTALKAELYMVRSSHSVVAVGFYRHGRVNDHELSLEIEICVHGKNNSRK